MSSLEFSVLVKKEKRGVRTILFNFSVSVIVSFSFAFVCHFGMSVSSCPYLQRGANV